jgi:23S rRNA (cytidine1920-2'-O)/16S rRNA (cytidine1409-2'-O)-methyltransferase
VARNLRAGPAWWQAESGRPKVSEKVRDAAKRADLVLVERGFAESRAKARAAIEAGRVLANGAVVSKASELIAADAAIDYAPAHPWVSRGGVKLAHALDIFALRPAGRICLDIGASTGGFSEVLLARGAARVYAVDVGVDQLHASLRKHPRIVSLENTDARALTRAQIGEAPSLIVCDVSFIGAAKALAASLACAAERADLVVLVKPQFEAGPGHGGVLREAAARAAGKHGIETLDGLAGFDFIAATDSPIRGGDGNFELLAHFRR